MDLLKKAREYEDIHRVPAEERPEFHAVPPVGWMNDPNGFGVYDGEVHLFFQYHPYSTQWGPMYWGHLRTKDLVRWEDCKAALAPDSPDDEDGCFSGSAIQTDAGHVLVYTGLTKDAVSGMVLQNQCIAVGDGTDYKKIPENPVVTGNMLPDGFSREDFRDPKIWKDGETYYMVVGNRDKDGMGQIVLFSGTDITHWKYEGVLAHNDGTLGSMWECPDFFGLDGTQVLICSPQDMSAQGYAFHNGNNAVYFLGDFDKEENVFRKGEACSLDYGLDFYAPQTIGLPDGRRIMIAWMKSWDSSFIPEGQRWHGMMTLPRELRVEDGKLLQTPIRELASYHRNKVAYEREVVEGEKSFDGISGRCIDFTVRIHSGEFQEFVVDVAKNDKYFTRFVIDKKRGILEIDRTYAGMIRDIVCIRRVALPDLKDGMQLRFIMDRNSVELFVDDGQIVCSTVIYTPLEAQDILFACDGSAVVSIEKYDIG